jgi:signal transduction histidine kinase
LLSAGLTISYLDAPSTFRPEIGVPNLLKQYKYTLGGLIFSLIILLFGRAVHFFAEEAAPVHALPQSPHDRIMFLLVFFLLVLLGYFADRSTRNLIAHEEEKLRIFTSAVSASQHILNNFLNNMLYFQQQARESRALDEKTLELLVTVIHDAAGQLKKLGEISEISENKIRETIYPG